MDTTDILMNDDPVPSYTKACDTLSKKNTDHSAKGAIIQHYAISLEQQPSISTSGFPDKIKPLVDTLNDDLQAALKHAQYYRKTLLPEVLARLVDADEYYQEHQALQHILSDTTSETTFDELKDLINSLIDEVSGKNGYMDAINKTKKDIDAFQDKLNSDANAFATDVGKFTTAVGGTDVVHKYEQELEQVQAAYEKALAVITASVFAQIGGIFLIIAGAVSTPFTFGTTVPVVLGGIALIGAGTTAEVVEGTQLEDLTRKKGELLTAIYDVQKELAQAKAIEKGYVGLGTQCKAASCATGDLANAWSFLHDGLKAFLHWVERIKGKKSVKAAELYMITLKSTIIAIREQIKSIRKKFTDSSGHGKELRAFILQNKMNKVALKVEQLHEKLAAGETAVAKLLIASIRIRLNSLAEMMQEPEDGGLEKHTDYNQPVYTLIKKYVPGT